MYRVAVKDELVVRSKETTIWIVICHYQLPSPTHPISGVGSATALKFATV